MKRAIDGLRSGLSHSKFEAASAALVMGLMVILTRDGIALDPDSPTYLYTARFFRSDPSAVFSPPTGTSLSIRGLFPPLYPILLAITGSLGGVIGAARILGIALAGASTWLLLGLVRRHSSTWTAVAVALLVLASRSYLLVTFGFLMTEGLYVTLALASLAALAPLLATGAGQDLRRYRALAVTAAVFASAAMGTRYVGLGVVLAVTIILVAFTDAPRRERLRMAAISLVVGIAPTVAWTAVAGGSGATGDRSLGIRSVGSAEFWSVGELPHHYLPRQGIDLLGTWGSRAIGGVLFVGLAAWSIGRLMAAVRPRADVPTRMCAAFLLVGWGHLGTLVATRILVDLLIPLGGRHTLLWSTALIAAVGIDAHRRLAAAPASTTRWAAPATVAAVSLLTVGAALPFAQSLRDPLESWSNLAQADRSALADQLADTPDDMAIYTNREDLVYLQTGHDTRLLPEPTNRYSGEPLPDFEDRLRAIGGDVADGRAVIVVFTEDVAWAPTIEELESLTGVEAYERTDEAAIVGRPSG